MVKNHKKLIGVFVLLFLILVGIQIYFLYKTYKIKESQTYDYIIKKIDLYRDDIKKEYGLREDTVKNYFVKFREGKISEKQFRSNINRLNKNSIQTYSNLIDSIFSKDHYEVANRYDLLSTQYLPDNKYLFTKPITIFETNRKVTKSGKTEDGTWDTSTTEEDTIGNVKPRGNTYRSKTANYYEIKNIKSIVFKDLWILIISCILILAAVLWIFILTIRNLIRQQKQVDVLHTVVDNIAHEFKTPIATLKIASKALKKDWNQASLPLVERQITRLENLMNQLNNDKENDIENQEISNTDWDLFVEDLKFLNPDTEFNVKNNSGNSLPFNKTDMETIFKNLCENSVKYGASIVKIELDSTANHLKIIISDNGKGIARKEQKNIFEKFYRIQSDNIHNTKGLGFGLFLVKNLAEKYKGKIELSSEVNQGTTFKITIPYEN